MSSVSILPINNTINSEFEIASEESIMPTKTFKVDFEKGRINGFCDGKEALKQAIYLILTIERYEYIIYSWDYGSEIIGLSNMDKDIAQSEYKRRITEALMIDDRIKSVDNFKFKYYRDGVNIDFTVSSVYGDIEVERMVK